ncbi:MAG: competence/damage-inducible protein A [Bdellovibrionaceae bacterium]|nr:competence/damage-inducible protein A [Pseudobdellovibrionaceae bacterium]NUM59497.1 competence/damage-inducible protein A [Pseudobdellovibrionaceae bacterium]
MKTTIKASHIAVGTELTNGQTLNTNSHFIASFLQKKGVINYYHLVVDDDRERIKQCLDLACETSDWVFIYGGLGPTSDDFTRHVVSEWTNVSLSLHQETWNYIQGYLAQRNYPVREFQIQQAYFPENATIMKNSKGTAHGFTFPWKKKQFFVLPGPPKEIQSICENFLYDYITKNTQNIDRWETEVWNTLGLGESEVANKIEPILKKANIKNDELVVGYRIHLPYVEVKLSCFNSQIEKFSEVFNQVDNTLKPLLVYKKEAPFKKNFFEFFKTHLSVEIQDEICQTLIFDDIKNWTHSLPSFKIRFSNYISFSQEINLIKINRIDEWKIQLTVKFSDISRTSVIEYTSVKLLPPERQILFLKEMIIIKLNEWFIGSAV